MKKVSLIKVKKYEKRAKIRGNDMLPVKMGIIKGLAILEMGARINIATKAMWKRRDRLPLREIPMDLRH